MTSLLEYSTWLLVHCALTFFMVGLIWFVQVVHYPLFGKLRALGESSFGGYSSEHQRRTSRVVIAPMLGEAATCVALLLVAPNSERALAWIGLVLLAVVWLSTFFLQVPRHARLLDGFDQPTIRTLVATNWIRTGAWTLRGALCLLLLARAMDSS